VTSLGFEAWDLKRWAIDFFPIRQLSDEMKKFSCLSELFTEYLIYIDQVSI